MNNSIKMIFTLTLIGVISGGLLFAVNKWSEGYIREHSDNSTKDAIFQVIPGASDYKIKALLDVPFPVTRRPLPARKSLTLPLPE